jgi:hypothetical protein
MPVSCGSGLAATVLPSGEELVTGRQEESAAASTAAAETRKANRIVGIPFAPRSFGGKSGETAAD